MTAPAPIYRGQANSLFRTDKQNKVYARGQEAPYGTNGAPPAITPKPGWTADTGTADRASHATYTAPTISNPPTQAEVQAIATALQAATQEIKALKDDLIAQSILGP